METFDLNHEIEPTDSEEIDIEIDYKCHFGSKAFSPMTIYTSIHEGTSLQKEIREGKARYEKDYEKVEVIEVRVDL